MLVAQVGKLLGLCVRNGAATIAVPIRREAMKAGAALVAVLLALAAAGCVAAAIWIFAVPYVGSAGAALISSAYLLFAGLMTFLISTSVIKKETRPVAENLAAQTPLVMNQLFVEHKGTLLVAALVAGMMAAESQRKR